MKTRHEPDLKHNIKHENQIQENIWAPCGDGCKQRVIHITDTAQRNAATHHRISYAWMLGEGSRYRLPWGFFFGILAALRLGHYVAGHPIFTVGHYRA